MNVGDVIKVKNRGELRCPRRAERGDQIINTWQAEELSLARCSESREVEIPRAVSRRAKVLHGAERVGSVGNDTVNERADFARDGVVGNAAVASGLKKVLTLAHSEAGAANETSLGLSITR